MTNWRKGGEFVPISLTIEEMLEKSLEGRRKPSAPRKIVSKRTGRFYKHSQSTETIGKDGSRLPGKTGLPYKPPPGWTSSKPPIPSETDKKNYMPFTDSEQERPVKPAQIEEEIFVPGTAGIKRDACQPSYTLLTNHDRWKPKEIEAILAALGQYCSDHWVDWSEGKLLLKGGIWPEWLFREIIKRSNKKSSKKPDFEARHYALYCELPIKLQKMMGSEHKDHAQSKRELPASQ